IVVDAFVTGDEVCVAVADQGVGIEPNEIRRIFERFYRSSRGNLQNVRGSGLGLALVNASIEAHGGRIDVSSEPGRGSRFLIALPMPGRSHSLPDTCRQS